MKEFSIQEQIYICKNVNSKPLENLAVNTLSTMKEVKEEFEAMRKDGRYEKYRKLTEEDVQKMLHKDDENKNNTREYTRIHENTLLGLNDVLFRELDKLRNVTATGERLETELKISRQVVSVSQTIINNANLLLNAKKYIDSSEGKEDRISPLLSLGK